MKLRVIAALLLVTSTVAAAPAKPKPQPPGVAAPETLAHTDAMFLSSICNQGARRITIKAVALSTRFFLEEPAGVTVYVYDGVRYRRVKFLKGSTLEKAVKTYPKTP